MNELTTNELLDIHDTFSPLIEYVAWQLSVKTRNEAYNDFLTLGTNRVEYAARQYKEKFGEIKLDKKFTTCMKEVLWKFQQQIARAMSEPLPVTSGEWMMAFEDVKLAREIEQRFEVMGLNKPDFGFREVKCDEELNTPDVVAKNELKARIVPRKK